MGHPAFLLFCSTMLKQRLPSAIDRVLRATERLSLGWKIYLSLTIILIPVFVLTLFVQTQLTSPLLEDEVRLIGTSACRSLASDIIAFHLLGKPDQLEARLIEVTWQQPSVVRLDVLVPNPAPTGNDPAPRKIIASSVVEETPADLSALPVSDTPQVELKREFGHGYWEIVYPIREHKKILGHIHAQVSLQLVHQVVGIFTKISFLGNLLAIFLLIGLLSYYLRHLIENERRLERAELKNVELIEQLHEIRRQLFLNEKLAIMGQMTASFAHEVGTPLNSMSGHLQLLREEVPEASKQSRIDVINSQVVRIEQIVKDFLASTHMPARQTELVDVKDLIQRIQKLVSPRIAAVGAEVHVDIAECLQPIRVVPTDIEQVLLNLTNNAIDALEKGTADRRLIFQARQTGTDGRPILEILVCDTGEGIPPENIKQVLKPFFTTKAPGEGTGLGLTISQRLLKKYGGRVELESALGKGTTITVSIPYGMV